MAPTASRGQDQSTPATTSPDNSVNNKSHAMTAEQQSEATADRELIRVTTVCPGLMRTGGETHAHFRGQIRKEKAWFKTSARTPFLAASATYAAEQIFTAVDAGRAELTITPQAWLAARFAGLAPETTQFLSALVNAYVLPRPSRTTSMNPPEVQQTEAYMAPARTKSGKW